jgi:hypothetical protein
MVLSAIKNSASSSAMIYINLSRLTSIMNLEFLKMFG